MNKIDKIILGTVSFVFVSFSVFIVYTDISLRERYPDIFTDTFIIDFLKPLDQVIFSNTYEIKKEFIFETMADVDNYPKILPKNILSVDIINKTQNTIFAKETITERGIKSNFLVKHTLKPYDQHIIEIIGGNANGTRIIQDFESQGNYTKITTQMDLSFQGALSIVSYLPAGEIRHAMNFINHEFINYSKGFDIPSHKIVDDLYREILLRSADEQGLLHYSTLLENEKITIDEIKIILLNSDERKTILLLSEIKSLDEIDPKTKKIVDDLYREILLRSADEQGLLHYSTLLENEKITVDEIKNSLIASDEYNSMK